MICLMAIVASAAAQSAIRTVTSSTPDASRAELTHRLDSLVRDSAYGKPKDRDARRAEIAALRMRLTNGDFRTGDRFLIDYGDPLRRPDTVIVRDSSNISLLNWPSTSLHGILQSELQGAVDKYAGTYVREPRLRVYPLMRLVITGGFARPGAYAVDPNRPLSDAIMVAGGLGQTSAAEKIEVFRGGERLLEKKEVQRAIASGETVEQLGLRSGDEIRAPEPRNASGGLGRSMKIQTILFTVSIITAVLAFIRSSYVP
jgi:hypothetical protein